MALDTRDIRNLRELFSAIREGGFTPNLNKLSSLVRTESLNALRKLPQFKAEQFKDDKLLINSVIEYIKKDSKQIRIFLKDAELSQIEQDELAEPLEKTVTEGDGSEQSTGPAEQPAGAGQAPGGEPANTMSGGTPLPGMMAGGAAARAGRRIIHTIPHTGAPAETQSKLFVADKSGNIVQERTITPTSSTINKPEAPSKIAIADKSGNIVGERSLTGEAIKSPTPRIAIADKSGNVIGERSLAGKTIKPPESKLFVADKSGNVIGERSIKPPYGISKNAADFRSWLGRNTKIGSGRVLNGLGDMFKGLGGVGRDAAGASVKALGRAGLRAGNFGARLSNQVTRRGLLSSVKKGFEKGMGRKVALALFLGMLSFGIFSGIIGGLGGQQIPIGQAAPISSTSNILDYTLPIKDPSVVPADIRAAVLAEYPKAQIQYWDQIIAAARGYGLNPALALTLWIEETGASQYTLVANGGGGVPAGYRADGTPYYSTGHLGCNPGEDQTVDESVRCLNNFVNRYNFTNNQFPEFMAKYSGGPASAPFSNNPNFPNRFKKWYSQLVASGPGALVAVSAPSQQPAGSIGFSVSCPLGGNTTISCGTAANPVNNCGHGGIGYATICDPVYYACNGTRYSDALYHAIDVQGGSSVTLPFINGNQSIEWVKDGGVIPIGGGTWGYRINYSANYNGKKLSLDLTHLNIQINPSATLNSGAQVGTVFAGIGHLHTAIAVDGRWIEPVAEAGMCSR